MFEKYYEQVSQNNNKKDYVTMDFINNIATNEGALYSTLRDPDKLSDNDLYTIISNSYSIILEDIFVGNNKDTALALFSNPKFLMCATQVFYNVQLSHEQRVYVNKLAYDYLTLEQSKRDQYIANLLKVLCRTVNRDIIPTLMGLNLNENLSTLLAIARYSSLKEIVNVKRINVLICDESSEIMTEQMVVRIYEVLFDSITPLFKGIILDSWDDSDLQDEDVVEIYSTINLALLDIVEDLTSSIMRQLFIGFIQDKQLVYQDVRLRFDITSCSQVDYPRILGMIDYLAKEENLIMPRC